MSFSSTSCAVLYTLSWFAGVYPRVLFILLRYTANFQKLLLVLNCLFQLINGRVQRSQKNERSRAMIKFVEETDHSSMWIVFISSEESGCECYTLSKERHARKV